MNSKERLVYGHHIIEYELSYQDRKSLGIKVFPDCSVKVTAPLEASAEKIEVKIKAKAPWIIRQQNEFLSYRPLTPQRKFINGETHLYLGRQYKLNIEPAVKNEVKLYRGRLIIYYSPISSPKKVLNQWYREKAEIRFRKTMLDMIPSFNKYRIGTPALQIRAMEKRWGSCTSGGKIILNTELVKAPKGCIEYVIIHELCHIVHHNHTKAFYLLQESIMPDWKKWKERLEYGLA